MRLRRDFAAFTILLALAVSPAVAQQAPAAPNAVERLLERVTGAGTETAASVYVAALPDGFPRDVPLPLSVTLVGSVRRTNADGYATSIYYDVNGPIDQTAMTYAARLRAAGWIETQPLGGLDGGFARVPYLTAFCANGRPTITLMLPDAANSRNLTVAVAQSGSPWLCVNALEPRGSTGAPLPRLVAPPETSMDGVPGAPGTSTATLVSSAPLSALIAALAGQLTAAHWKPVDRTIGKRTGMATFTITDGHGVRWDAVLTIYGSVDKPTTYYATLSAANRSADEGPAAS